MSPKPLVAGRTGVESDGARGFFCGLPLARAPPGWWGRHGEQERRFPLASREGPYEFPQKRISWRCGTSEGLSTASPQMRAAVPPGPNEAVGLRMRHMNARRQGSGS
jgi:hypothetical protein